MSFALDRRRIDKSSLALSVGFHLLLLLLFILSRQQSKEVPAPAVAAPPMTLDLSIGPEESPAKLQKLEPAAKASVRGQPAKAVTAPAPPNAPDIAPPPVVLPVVPAPVQLPAFASTGSSSANVISSSTGAGTAGVSRGLGTAGSGSGTGAANSGSGGGSASGADTAERPDWIEKPTDDERMMVVSSSARIDHANGWAVLSCLVTRSKTVRACKVLAESSDSQGQHPYAFGRSALQLSKYFRIRPPMRDGQPRYDIRVRIPIYWTWK